ncbi:calcium-binding protein [Aurantimonas sp. 22II-16-19i]|uniref:calcium-binding protein n=1 Tax=Aurantimonas sp. 22II-16-19i TaxID=1317114 RepID=UPI00111C4ABC|nr:calcium-binding protein [Aurantimonas sp. 22II-16-19i]
MTTVISNSQTRGLAITDATIGNGSFIVLPNVYIQSDIGSSGDAIYVSATIDNAVITVGGWLIADDDGVLVNGGDRVVLTSTGSIVSNYGLYASGTGGGNHFIVAGTIAADYEGILFASSNNTATISGHVSAQYGIADGASNSVHITAGGVVQGWDIGYRLVGLSSDTSTLVNDGTLVGGSTGAIAGPPGSSLVFTNSGMTQGNVTLVDGADSIVNSGVISGNVGLAGGADSIVNSGKISGNVDLGAGADVFRMLGSGTVTGDIAGGAGNDVFRGADVSDRFLGGDDNDTFYGGGGNDLLFGEAGNDRFFADTDAIADTYNGGDGNDTVNYLLASAGIRLNFALNYALGADIGVDRLFSIENAAGGAGNDSLTGSDTTIALGGGAGDDTLLGGTGNNTLDGGDGADVIRGFAGFDKITGGAGDDTLTGDFNADTFIFADGFGKDTITDFDEFNNAEKINLAGVTSITDFADLAASHITQVSADAIIIDGANTITLLNVNLADLDANDFIF